MAHKGVFGFLSAFGETLRLAPHEEYISLQRVVLSLLDLDHHALVFLLPCPHASRMAPAPGPQCPPSLAQASETSWLWGSNAGAVALGERKPSPSQDETLHGEEGAGGFVGLSWTLAGGSSRFQAKAAGWSQEGRTVEPREPAWSSPQASVPGRKRHSGVASITAESLPLLLQSVAAPPRSRALRRQPPGSRGAEPRAEERGEAREPGRGSREGGGSRQAEGGAGKEGVGRGREREGE